MTTATLIKPEAKTGSSKWHILIAAWLGALFDGFDATIFTIVLFPAMSELLGTTSHSLVGVYGSYILASQLVGYFIGGVSFGMLADKIGRTKTMVITILLYASFTGLCALSHNWMDLAFYRFLVGCGIGGEISVAGVMLAESWNSKTRLQAMGLFVGAFPAGYALAALLNLFVGNIGWRWMFVAGIIPALLTVYIRSKLKEPVAFELAQKAKQLAKTNAKQLSNNSMTASLPLLEVFNAKNRAKTILAICISSVTIIGFWAVLSWVSPWINQLVGTKAVAERSWALFTMNIGGLLGCCLAGPLVLKLDRKKSFLLVFLGALTCSLGMFLTVKSFGPAFLAWTFFVGMFANMPFALMMIYLPELFDTHIRGTAVGFTYNAGRILGAVAALGSGQLIALFGGSYAMAGACGACLYLIGIASSFFIKPTINSLEHSNLTRVDSHTPELAHRV